MLVATAGHIDHGKSALVRALTGVETDRLPEEKARGISIDLGFAYWQPDAGATIGFVDVPGHERFVRNMIAGLSGIEFALLVIAADDGIMPQTVEHLRILQLAGVRRLFTILTKIDRVAPERIAEISQAAAALLKPTPFADAPLFAVNALDGTGIPALADALLGERQQLPSRDGEGFRLSIDRSFSIAGAGTVVTGTVVAGRAAIGENLILSPTGKPVRIRAMQSAGQDVDSISCGERCAVNLSGIDRTDTHRGDWLVSSGGHFPTSRIDATFAVCADREKPLRHDSAVQVHHGTASIGARVLVPRQQSLTPGTHTMVQLVLDAPTSVLTGDRLVLRDPSDRELLGGGRVIDPFPVTHRRALAEREAKAAALLLDQPLDRLLALSASPGIEPNMGWFAACTNLSAAHLEQMVDGADIVRAGVSGEIVIAAGRFAGLAEDLVRVISRYHTDHPNQGGMPRRTARAQMSEGVSPVLFGCVLKTVIGARRIEVDGALMRIPGHVPGYSQSEIDFWREVLSMLDGRPAKAIGPAELARELRMSEAPVQAMLQRRKASGDLWQVTGTKFMLRPHVAGLATLAAELDSSDAPGFTAGDFRDASGIGRNFVIHLLEFFDRIGVTRRSGEVRRMRSDWESVVGTAQPLRPPMG